MKRLKTGKVQIIDKKNHFFSRIHVEDIANILFKSLDNFKNNEIYNISDDKPASQFDVANYGARLLKLDLPKSVKLEELESEMLKNFYKDSKPNKKVISFINDLYTNNFHIKIFTARFMGQCNGNKKRVNR